MTVVLVVDDNEVDRERVRRLLRGAMTVREAATGAEGLEACRAEPPDCVLLDHRLPDADGADLIQALVGLGVAIVMLSGQGSEQLAVTALKRGAHDYLPKDGLTEAALRAAVRHALHARDLQREVAERQAELARSENHMRLLVDQLPCVVWTTDPAPVVTSVGGAALPGVMGPDDIGRTPQAALADAHAEALCGRVTRAALEVGARRVEAELRPLRSTTDEVVGVVGVALDVTEQRDLEAQLRHAQKMEALGRLAGGVAHDFNNLLTAMIGFTRFAQEALPEGAPARDDLDEVLRAAARAEELTRQLLAVARRRPPPERGSVRPDQALDGTLKMLRRLVGSTIDLETRIGADLWCVAIDATGFEQVVLNLVVNARDAMPEGGRVYVELENVTVEEPLEDARGERATPGPYVRLVVADTGVGMPPEVRERLFEPFFTTKPLGEGTGLGLATVYGIVRQAGGMVYVYTEPGLGTTFRVLIPAHPGQVTAPEPPPATSTTGDERILVVEDDPSIRTLVERTLQGAGYAAEVVADGRTALERVDAGPAPDLVLADMVTPGLDVTDLVEELLSRGRRVALMTGWAPRSLRPDSRLAALPMLEKPFGPPGLLAFVRRALDDTAVVAR